MKKLNNKILIISFIVLLGIFVISKLFRSPSLSSNMNVSVFKIDTSTVTEIRIHPQKDSTTELRLFVDENHWLVAKNDIKSKVQPQQIKNLKSTIAQLKPERIVSRKKDKWKEYNVDDSTSTSVSILNEDEEILSFKIGKEANGATYLRIANEDEVYAMHSTLQEQFNKSFNDWRDPSFIRLQKEKLIRISFQYPADSGFVIEKKGEEWFIENTKVDSVQIEMYLNKIGTKEHTIFSDDFKPLNSPTVIITFRNDSNAETVVKGWQRSFYQWVLNSNLQPDTYFLDEGSKLANELFAGKKDFPAKP